MGQRSSNVVDLEQFRFSRSTDPDYDPVFGPSLPYGHTPVLRPTFRRRLYALHSITALVAGFIGRGLRGTARERDWS